MAYRELIFTVVAEIAEPLGDALLELGALSVTVEDDAAGGYDENPLYGEPGLSPEVQAWDRSSVTALFNPEIDHSDAPDFISNLLTSLKDLGFDISPPEERRVEEQDWVRLTQSQFAPIQIGKRIWVVPSWHETPSNDPDAICLAVDPGLAFGTGSHPTTHLCLLWLEQHTQLRNHTLLDYGCGSGILAIAAAKLGCTAVVGTDIDPQAIVAARSNAQINQVEIQFILPNEDAIELAPDTQYDIVMANILANPLQVLAPALVNKIRPGGQIVLSGVLARQAEEVIATYRQWLGLSIWKESEGWVCLQGTLPSKSQNHFLGGIKKKVKLVLLALFWVLVLLFSEHMFRQTLLPALAPYSDNNSNSFSQRAFSVLQHVDRQLCNALGCTDRPVSDFSAWKITAASLALDNAQEGLKNPPKQSILQVDIQNRLTLPVLWPSLEVSLTDAEESVIQTITFTPDQWIPSQFQELHPNFLRTGASALESIHTELVITLANQVAGYRVRLFYPSH